MSQPARIFIITSANMQLMDRQLALVWQQEAVILKVEGGGMNDRILSWTGDLARIVINGCQHANVYCQLIFVRSAGLGSLDCCLPITLLIWLQGVGQCLSVVCRAHTCNLCCICCPDAKCHPICSHGGTPYPETLIARARSVKLLTVKS